MVNDEQLLHVARVQRRGVATRTALGRVWAVAWLLIAFGCSDGPRNNQVLATRADVITFAGMLKGQESAAFYALNGTTGSYDFFGFARATTPFNDAAGKTWYRYSVDLPLPQGDAYWLEKTNSTELRGLRTRLADGTDAVTFDVDDDACLSANIETLSGEQLATTCKSAQSPTVKVSYPTGGWHQPCFRNKASLCAPNLVCNRHSTCVGIDEVTKPFKGDVSCVWGTKDCNRCVNNVATQLAALPIFPKTFEVEGFHYPANHWFAPRLDDEVNKYEHIQGVGRITGSGDNWFVYGVSINSDKSDARASLMYPKIGQAGPATGGFRFGTDLLQDNNGNCSGYTIDTCPYNRNWTRNFFEGNGRLMAPTPGTYTLFPAASASSVETRTNHVSGIQVVGQLVANVNICQSQGSSAWCEAEPHYRTFVISDASNPARPQTINRLALQPHVVAHGSSGLANASMVKLASGNQLIHAYGHFFVSDRATISASTKWLRVDSDVFKLPPAPLGEYNNMSMLTECGTGDIYAMPISGAGGLMSYHRVSAHKLGWDGSDVAYSNSLASDLLFTGQAYYRAGSSLYVDPIGRLVLYATSLDQDDNGNIIITEH